MKRLRSFFLICSLLSIFSFNTLAAESYLISTSKETDVKVSIPEGYTELEAFLEMSKLYLEERYDHQELLDSIEGLKETVEDYKQKNDELNAVVSELNTKNTELASLYKEKSRPSLFTPIAGLSVTTENTVSIDFGVNVLDKVDISTVISYPFAAGLRIGVEF